MKIKRRMNYEKAKKMLIVCLVSVIMLNPFTVCAVSNYTGILPKDGTTVSEALTLSITLTNDGKTGMTVT